MRQLLVPLLSLPLLACQSAALFDNSASLPPAGSRLVLKQELTIPAGTAHVTLQGGRVVSGNDVRSYHPYCELEVHKVLDVPQKVGPDEFVIRRAYQESRTVSSGGIRPASGRVGFFMNGASVLVFRTVFRLSSSRQPDVRWLVCEQWGDTVSGTHLTLDEIRKALGDVMTLAPATSGKHPA